MRHKTYMSLVSFVFLLVGLAHLYRAYRGYALIVGHTHIATVWSWVAGALALYLSYQGYKHRR